MDLSHETMNMSHRAEAYVLMTKDVILHREVHLAKTHLLKLSDVNFTSTCSIIYHTAHDNREVLMKYGVGKASLMHLRASIDNYQAVMGAPKEAITKRKQLTHQLAQRIVEQRAILDKIYTLMSIMQYTQPAMYALYKDTRVVLYRSRSLAGMCRVTDATSAKAVAGATLTFYQDEVPVLKKSIAKGGGSRIKSLSNGTYILTVSRPGYTAQTLTVHISNTKLITINPASAQSTLVLFFFCHTFCNPRTIWHIAFSRFSKRSISQSTRKAKKTFALQPPPPCYTYARKNNSKLLYITCSYIRSPPDGETTGINIT